MASDFSGPLVTFRSRLFGFDKEEVRICLRNLIADHEDARKQIERLTSNLETLRAAGSEMVRQETAGVQVERVLASAHRVAQEVKAETENAARQVLREAQEEAALMRTNAETDAAELTRSSVTRAAELESEIKNLIDRRQAVQAVLDREADRLDEIARAMRTPAGSPVESSPARMSVII